MSRSSRPSRVDEAVEAILARVVSGEFAAGAALPGQWELAELMQVSRLTVREAVKELAAKGIVSVEPGNGTFVRPSTEWTDLSALSRLETDDSRIAVSVIEIRRMIEVAAAGLCAQRRTDADLASLRANLAGMESAHDAGDVATFVARDLAFHQSVLHGCANPFLAVVYDPLTKVMTATRGQTSAVPVIRQHAIGHHRAILERIAARDPAGASAAMDAHMDQTSDDLHVHVLGAASALGTVIDADADIPAAPDTAAEHSEA